MAGDEIKHKNSFLMSLNGQIQSAFFPFFDDVYCKYSFVCGPDWLIISGVEEGISQISKKGRDEDQLFVWNLPLNIVFKSTNPFGWPQLVVSAYGSDAFDNEVVRGYGVCHAPIAPGRYEKEIQFYYSEIHVVAHWEATRVYRPKDSHTRRCERRVRSQGSVKAVFDVTLKDLQPLGYRYA